MLREVADLEVVAALTASRIGTADLGRHGGWPEVPPWGWRQRST